VSRGPQFGAAPVAARAGCTGRVRRGVPSAVVWTVDLADARWDVDEAARTLLPDELRRADRAPAVRRRRILLRAALRRVLADVLRTAPRDVPLVVDGGRPVLHAGSRPQLGISCSASDGVGLVALTSGAAVGVDVQGVPGEGLARARAEGWLTRHEAGAIAGLPLADQAVAVARCWTQKEAVLKGETVGLHRSPATIGTPVSPAGRCGRWWLLPVDVPAGSVGSLAVAARRAPRVVGRLLTPVGRS
jgi:4'-phosphopantetheinyl transferase